MQRISLAMMWMEHETLTLLATINGLASSALNEDALHSL